MARPVLVALMLLVPAFGLAQDLPEHPSQRVGASGERVTILGPVEVGGRRLYAVGADVLELSPEGVVVRRARFPGPVRALAVDGEALKVTVGMESPDTPSDLVHVVPYRPGTDGPASPVWARARRSWLLSFRDAQVAIDAFRDPATDEVPDAKLAEVADRLAALAARDPTNPFFPAFQGQALARLGRKDEAARAFAAAADAPAVWSDLLRVANDLENLGAPGEATRAFDRGLAAAGAAGVPLLETRFYLFKADVALPAAGAARDADAVHRILSRHALAFPRHEDRRSVWPRVARWMADAGRPDLAAEWQRRASAFPDDYKASMQAKYACIDLAIPWGAGMMWAFVVLALVCGVARGTAQRQAGARVAWIARPRLLDVVALALPLAAGTLLVGLTNGHLRAQQRLYDTALVDLEAWSAPGVVADIERNLHPSEARARLVAHARAETARIQSGAAGPVPALAGKDELLLAAFEATDLDERVEDALQPPAQGYDVMSSGAPAVAGFLFARSALIFGLIALVVGGVLGASAPRVAPWLTRLVPGAATGLGVLRGVVLGALFGGVLYLLMPALFQRALVDVDAGKLLAAPFLPPPASPPAAWWPWLVIAAALAAHVVALRRERGRRPA